MSVQPTLQTSVEQTQQPQPVQAPPALVWKTPVNLKNNHRLARTIGWETPKLLTLLSKNKSEHYTTFSIRKKSGKKRYIHNPSSLMRVAQYRILTRILDKLTLPDYIFAFERDKSIPGMADLHIGKRCVISVDIKDFFHSITQAKVKALLQDLGIRSTPATTMSELMTFKSFVPQGALTSPKVSNLIAATTFGPEIKTLCDQKGYTLTIYADDVTISSDGPMEIKETIDALLEIITRHGFRINKQKTKVMTSARRQYVCGVVVNSKRNLPVQERDLLKAQVHNVERNGVAQAALDNGFETPEAFIHHLKGRLNWFKQLNQPKADKLILRLNNALSKLV